MSKLLSIDLSHASRVVVAVFEQGLRENKLLAIHRLHPSEDQSPAEALGGFLTTEELEGANCIAIYPGGLTSSWQVSLPFGDAKRIERTLPFELEASIPFSADEISIAWQRIEGNDKESLSYALFTPTHTLESFLEDLESVGLEPRSVLPPAASLLGLELASRPTRSPSPDASSQNETLDAQDARNRAFYVQDGDTHHLLCLNATGRPVLSRSIRGSRAVAQSQLLAAFEALPKHLYPERLSYFGGSEDAAVVDAWAREHLDIEVESPGPGPIQRAIGTMQSIQPGDLLALGAANLLAKSKRKVPLDLRSGRFAYAGDLAAYKGDLRRFAFGGAALAVVAILSLSVQAWTLSKEEEKLDAAFCKLTQQVAQERICDHKRALAELRNPSAGNLGIPEYGADTLFEMLSMAVRPELDVKFSKLEFKVGQSEDTISGDATASEFKAVQSLQQELEKLPCFNKVETGNQVGDEVKFDFSASGKCPSGHSPTTGLSAPEDQGGPRAAQEEEEAPPPTPRSQRIERSEREEREEASPNPMLRRPNIADPRFRRTPRSLRGKVDTAMPPPSEHKRGGPKGRGPRQDAGGGQ